MYLHNAFMDPQIVPLWVKKGTPGVHAQYSNNGVYTNWDNIMAYHAQRPAPKGKLTFHYTTTPLIEIAEDGQTAKGLWVMSGVESGLTDLEAAKQAPDFMYEKELVDGKKVWMHSVLVKYGVDFLKQDGEWIVAIDVGEWLQGYAAVTVGEAAAWALVAWWDSGTSSN